MMTDDLYREEIALAWEMAEEERKHKLTLPNVIATYRIADWDMSVELVVSMPPELPEWYRQENENNGENWAMEQVFGYSFGAELRAAIVNEGLQPGDLVTLRVFEPRYTVDYWGEGDCQYTVDLIEVRQGCKTPRTRKHRLMRHLQALRKEQKEKQKRWRWFNRWIAAPAQRHLLHYTLGFYDDGGFARIVVNVPRQACKWNGYWPNAELLRIDIDRFTTPKAEPTREALLAKLRAEAGEKLGITSAEFDRLTQYRHYG